MLSVIVPTKNRRDDLGLLVQSIEQQIVRPDQLVIVDQSDVGCEDDIFAILSKTEVDISMCTIQKFHHSSKQSMSV